MALTPVQKELGRIAAEYRRYVYLRLLAICWAGLVVLSVGFIFLNFAFRFAHPAVLPILVVVAIGSAIFARIKTRKVQFTLRDIARQVEKDDPELNTLLLAAVDQEPDPATGRLNLLQLRVIAEALVANRKSPWHKKFTERLFLAECAQLGTLTLLLLAMFALVYARPGGMPAVWERLTQIKITPGTAEVERGSTVAIIAEFPKAPQGEVRLVYSTKSQGEKSFVMNRSLKDPLFGATISDIQEDAAYRIVFSNGESPEHQLTVFEYPELKRADAELEFPKYTRLERSKIEDTRRISAVEGTRVSYSFYLNKPVRSARLAGIDSQVVLTNNPAASNLYSIEFILSESKNYKMELLDEKGRTNKIPTEFVFVALPNQLPKLKLISPRGDQRVSALQEIHFEGEAEDDFGLAGYGLAYTVGGKTEMIRLYPPSTEPSAMTNPHEARPFQWLFALEPTGVQPEDLASYFLWAEDMGPDGKLRQTTSDIYFAEVRPFEEIFRENNSNASSESQQRGSNQSDQLLDLQKQIIQATWNLKRRETGKQPSSNFVPDVKVIEESQRSALTRAEALGEEIQDAKAKSYLLTAIKAMQSASASLEESADKKSPVNLSTAVEFEQSAYQALLKLQAREYQVSRSRSSRGGENRGQQRAQRQLDQLELKQEENRYETESQASLQDPEQRETLQVLSRLKELARRQQDVSDRLKELQIALNEAKTEEERKTLERMLKRLQEEQEEIVQDMDELRQRMSQPENQGRMADARKQLDNTRSESQRAAQELDEKNVGQALSSATRAQQELQKLTDQFRKSTSNQFTEEMRNLRKESRELKEKQEEVAQKMEQMKDSRQRTLSDEGNKKEILDAIASQLNGLTNLLQNMRTVTEQAEHAEPLLSKQLYDTLRRASQSAPEKTLDLVRQMVEKNFLPDAARTEQRARETIEQLAEGVERAASSVLGNENEALRLAQKELEDLANRVERELRSASGEAGTTNSVAGGGEERSNTNRLAGAQGTEQNLNRLGSDQERQDRGGNRQQAGDQQNSQQNPAGNQTNQQQANANSQQPGQQGQSQAQNSQGQPGNQSTPSGQEPGRQASNQQGQGSPRDGNARQARSGQEGGRRNFFDRGANEGGSNTRGGGYEFLGPLTGADYTRWSDRLRDLEEILQDPDLRNEVSRVRDRARSMRSEFKRHATLPQWDLVQTEIVTPLRVLQDRVSEALARQNSKEALVPIDREPVPRKYSEAVSRYYEQLGKE